MSTISTTARPSRPANWLDEAADPYELPDLPLTPREGWTSVIALTVMMVVGAIAIDDAGWAGFSIGTRVSQTGFLPLAALLSTLLGAWLAKGELGTVRIHLVGSVAGALALLFFVSNAISGATSIEGRLHALNLSVSSFTNDVLVLGTRSSETSVFLLILGALVWAAGHFAAVAVFRRHRPMPAIILAGAIVLLNVSLTVREQYLHLLVYAAAALGLAVRLNLLEQAREWRIRGMRDVADISASFMRSGAVFVTVAIVASTLLATNASSAPLARVWNDFDDDILEVGYAINRWLGGVTGTARGPNVLFTPNQTIRDFWQSSSEEVFTAEISDGVGRRWRGATYDSFDGRTWQQLDRQAQVLDVGEQILGRTREAVSPGDGWQEVTSTVVPADYGGDVFVAPASPLTVDQPTEVLTRGAQGAFVAAKLGYGIQTGVPYTVHSLVRTTSGSRILTASQLAAAGTDYPGWVDPYLEIRPDSIGPGVYATAHAILGSLPSERRDPYHVAQAVQDYLYQAGDFQYVTDIRGECGGDSMVDCFLRIRQGFCEYFASAMVMMLRALDIPARYVLGYLPGQEQGDGTWRVDRSAAHAWVEVYFPSFGWVEFDPTPGNTENGQAPTRLPAGEPAPSPDADPFSPPGQGELECEAITCEDFGDPIVEPVVEPAPPVSQSPGSLFLAIGLILLAVLLAVWATWRRIPMTEPELAYSGITRLATRLGYGPRPAQTPFEYAARLGELVPVAAADLQLIATAKVEATYGHREAGESVLKNLAMAYRRVRLGLLRLLFRRPRVGHGPRSTRR